MKRMFQLSFNNAGIVQFVWLRILMTIAGGHTIFTVCFPRERLSRINKNIDVSNGAQTRERVLQFS